MKKIKSVKQFVIYELTAKEQAEYGFKYAPVLKEHVEAYGRVDPRDVDLECETLESAVTHATSWRR